VIVDGNRVDGYWGQGILFGETTSDGGGMSGINAICSNNYVSGLLSKSGGGSHGIRFLNTVMRTVVSGNIINSVGGTGIYMTPDKIQESSISGNVIKSPGSRGIWLSPLEAGEDDAMEAVSVSNNSVCDAGSDGIRVEGATQNDARYQCVSINGNRALRNGVRGIRVEGGHDGLMVLGNTSRNNSDLNFSSGSGGAHVVIENNFFED